jgi:hypothetical protein
MHFWSEKDAVENIVCTVCIESPSSRVKLSLSAHQIRYKDPETTYKRVPNGLNPAAFTVPATHKDGELEFDSLEHAERDNLKPIDKKGPCTVTITPDNVDADGDAFLRWWPELIDNSDDTFSIKGPFQNREPKKCRP